MLFQDYRCLFSSAMISEATDSLCFFQVELLKSKGKSNRSCLEICIQKEIYLPTAIKDKTLFLFCCSSEQRIAMTNISLSLETNKCSSVAEWVKHYNFPGQVVTSISFYCGSEANQNNYLLAITSETPCAVDETRCTHLDLHHFRASSSWSSTAISLLASTVTRLPYAITFFTQ